MSTSLLPRNGIFDPEVLSSNFCCRGVGRGRMDYGCMVEEIVFWIRMDSAVIQRSSRAQLQWMLIQKAP